MKMIVDGLAVNYEDQGNGKSLLLLHGWQQDLGTFDQLNSLLEKNFRVIRLDLPGFGDSELPKETWGVNDYAKFVRAFCDKLDVEPEIIAGHSFGGRVAIVLAGNEILHPRKVILIDSAGISHTGSLRNQALKAVAKTGKAVLSLPGLKSLQKPLRKKLYDKAGNSDYLSAGPLKKIYQETIQQDLTGVAAKISQPTLLIWGNADTETPLVEGEQLAGLIEDSRLEVMEGGHFIYLDYPKDVARLIKEFAK